MATTLEQRGVRAGDRVALMSSNRPEFVVALRAIWRLGAAAVLLSPAWRETEVERALALTKPTHAVGDHPVLAALMPMLQLDDPVTPELREFDAPDPEADALFVFSSGTTGMPKAVRHTHRGFAVAVRHSRDALGLSPDDRMQIVTPPSHILGLLNIVMALDTGAWIRLHRRFDIDQMLHHIEADRITIEMAVAPIALALAAHPKLDSYDLVVAAVRHVVCNPRHCKCRRSRHREGRRELGDRLRYKRIAGDRMQLARRGPVGHCRTPGTRGRSSGVRWRTARQWRPARSARFRPDRIP